MKERLAGVGIFPFTLPTPEAYGDYIKSEIREVREGGEGRRRAGGLTDEKG